MMIYDKGKTKCMFTIMILDYDEKLKSLNIRKEYRLAREDQRGSK